MWDQLAWQAEMGLLVSVTLEFWAPLSTGTGACCRAMGWPSIVVNCLAVALKRMACMTTKPHHLHHSAVALSLLGLLLLENGWSAGISM